MMAFPGFICGIFGRGPGPGSRGSSASDAFQNQLPPATGLRFALTTSPDRKCSADFATRADASFEAHGNAATMALNLSLTRVVKLVAVTETSAEIVPLKHRDLLQPHKGNYAEYDRKREHDH